MTRKLALSFGVHPIYCKPLAIHESFIPVMLNYLSGRNWITSEDLVVVIGGNFGVATGASFMEIATVANLRLKAELMNSR